MIDPSLFLAFVAAVTVLMLIPGPNVALIIANSVSYGAKYGFLTVAGTSSAMVAQLCLTAFGITALLGTLGIWLAWFRWIGVAYLVYLGIAQLRALSIDRTDTDPEPKSGRTIYVRALLVSLTNPKTLLFYSAFFPQFVTLDHDIGMQIILLSVTFLTLAVLVDGGWALLAGRARGLLAPQGHLPNKLSGGFLIGAGVALAFARNK